MVASCSTWAADQKGKTIKPAVGHIPPQTSFTSMFCLAHFNPQAFNCDLNYIYYQ